MDDAILDSRRAVAIRSPTDLARELARRARQLRRLACEQLERERLDDASASGAGALRHLFDVFTRAAGRDPRAATPADAEAFADELAQTVTCGLLAARAPGAAGPRDGVAFLADLFELRDPSWPAATHGGPGAALDERYLAQMDEIAALLDGIDVPRLFRADVRIGPDTGPDTGSFTGTDTGVAVGSDTDPDPDPDPDAGASDAASPADPVIHFYEPFLEAYDKTRRHERGVFFTPRAVVSYIVRGVHELLQSELGIEDGLASTLTWGEVAGRGIGVSVPDDVAAEAPFVCILDPATGTGTFLFECIDVVERTMKARWRRDLAAGSWRDPRIVARWQAYVPRHLLPRLHGCELLMAPCAIARLRLSVKLAETGYVARAGDRVQVDRANALDAPSASSRRPPFTVVLGNPPYAGQSSNMTAHAQALVEAYKIVDGVALHERKLWLQDDYVKFVRAAQLAIDRTGAGVLGYITNHGFLDNPTFRGMRQSLMRTFDSLRLLDLHGNANKKEQSPDGGEDKNVFAIRQGVAICLAVKGGRRRAGGGVQHADRWGAREAKHAWLRAHGVATTPWRPLAPEAPFYAFEPVCADHRAEYARGWRVSDIFRVSGAGFITARDRFVVSLDRDELLARMADFADPRLSDAAIREKYFAGRGSDKYPDGDTRGWKLPEARRRVRADARWRDRVITCLYRPFDERGIYWADWMIDWPRAEVMRHMLAPGALALSTTRAVEIDRFEHAWCARLPLGHHSVAAKEVNYLFPLWLAADAPEDGTRHERPVREANFAPAFLAALGDAMNRQPLNGSGLPEQTTAEEIFGYIYAVLHSRTFRTRYFAQLRNEFPRIPLPTPGLFAPLAETGTRLAAHHLLEAAHPVRALPTLVAAAPENAGAGSDAGARTEAHAAAEADAAVDIDKPAFADSTIWLDRRRTGGFGGVSPDVWGFRVGGYQICEQWLKDRKGRRLAPADVERFRRIVASIGETLRLMGEVDETIAAHGGWPGAFAAGGRPARD